MAKVFANGRSIVHKGDGGSNTCPQPDVCLTPVGSGMSPIPYVNTAKDADLVQGATSVEIEGNPVALKGSYLCKSSGDEPGTGGGLISGINKGKMTWVSCSPDVIIEGQGVIRYQDICLHNGNSPNTGGDPQDGSSDPPASVPNAQPSAASAPKTDVAVLEIYEHNNRLPAPVLVGTFQFKNDSGPIQVDGGGIPCGFAWDAASDTHPFGVVRISFQGSLKVTSYEPARSAVHTLRSRGGKEYDHKVASHEKNRGGYDFARADSANAELFGHLGIADERRFFATELRFNTEKKGWSVPFLYGENPREDWIYDAHRIPLSFVLQIGGERWVVAGPEIMVPAFEFRNDANLAAPELCNALRAEYGNPSLGARSVHVRDWGQCLDPATPVGNAFRRHLTTALNFIRPIIPAADQYDISDLEVAATFMEEGAIGTLAQAQGRGTDPDTLRFLGYNDIGIDSFITRWTNSEGLIRQMTSPALTQMIVAKRNLDTRRNEAQDEWTTFVVLGFGDAVHAVAVLYAHAKGALAADLVDPRIMGAWSVRLDELPEHMQFFWTTVYFNTGPVHGRSQLQQHGLEFHDPPWLQEDNDRLYNRQVKYNANWRTATYRLLHATVAMSAVAQPVPAGANSGSGAVASP